MRNLDRPARPLLWVGSSKKDYMEFSRPLREAFGFEMFLVQTGQHPPSAKPLKGLASGVLELREDFEGDAYRVVYAVRFSNAVYVLHAFKKKSKRGIETPKSDVDLIKRRLKDAEVDYSERFEKERR
jgi:phage-related protein